MQFESQARLSLPSGHASLSAFAVVFLSVYFHWRFKRLVGTQITLFIAEAFMITASLMICLSRVADNYHRYADVVVGVAIGAAFATMTVSDLGDAVIRHSPVPAVLPA